MTSIICFWIIFRRLARFVNLRWQLLITADFIIVISVARFCNQERRCAADVPLLAGNSQLGLIVVNLPDFLDQVAEPFILLVAFELLFHSHELDVRWLRRSLLFFFLWLGTLGIGRFRRHSWLPRRFRAQGRNVRARLLLTVAVQGLAVSILDLRHILRHVLLLSFD